MDDTETQINELQLLTSIYGKDWKANSRGEGEHTIDVKHERIVVCIWFTIPSNYPSISPLLCEISAPQLNKIQKSKIYNAISNIYVNHIGETLIYQYVEKVKEMLEMLAPIRKNCGSLANDIVTKTRNSPLGKCPNIAHSSVIEDRRSIFQGHAAILNSENDIELVINHFMIEKEDSEAAHNIIAWKFGKNKDYDDDGMKGAGSRLLHLFDLLGVDNVIVIVSRQYGGINLSHIKFKHVINVARLAIFALGLKR